MFGKIEFPYEFRNWGVRGGENHSVAKFFFDRVGQKSDLSDSIKYLNRRLYGKGGKPFHPFVG